MLSAEFAAAYASKKAYEVRFDDPTQQRALSAGHQWSEQFSVHLTNYLEGKTLPESEARNVVYGYERWLDGQFATDLKSILDDGTPHQDIGNFFEETSQHILNRSFAIVWTDVLSGTLPHKSTIEKAQLNLAIASIGLTMPLKRSHEAGQLFKWRKQRDHSHYVVTDPIYRGIMSATSELDTSVAMLEALKHEPGMVILPAPHQFEHAIGDSTLNCDLIEIDMRQKRAHGIQVKTSMRNRWAESKYDERYVTVVDGEQDLKNVIYLRQPDSSASSPVSMPGLYSAHHLANQRNLYRKGQQKGKNLTNRGLSSRLMQAQLAAREFSTLAESANDFVTRRMSQIAMRDLARD